MAPRVSKVIALLVAWPALSARGGPAARLSVEVRASGEVELHAREAPAAQVLELLAERAGIKLVYVDTPAPQGPLSLDVQAPTVAKAARQALEAMGLQYAMRTQGARIDTLLIIGASQARPSAAAPAAAEAEEDPETFGMIKPMAYAATPPPETPPPRSRTRPAELRATVPPPTPPPPRSTSPAAP